MKWYERRESISFMLGIGLTLTMVGAAFLFTWARFAPHSKHQPRYWCHDPRDFSATVAPIPIVPCDGMLAPGVVGPFVERAR